MCRPGEQTAVNIIKTVVSCTTFITIKFNNRLYEMMFYVPEK